MNINLFHPGNTFKSRDLHSLAGLNNEKFASCSMREIREIIEHDACEYFEVPIEKVYGLSRKGEYTTPRHVIMYLLCHYTTYSLKEIGLVL
jgi:chromosomal replication initiation ATPase DnaA